MATRILVVDDSLVARLLVEGLLCRNPDYLVELAEDGVDALAKVEAMPPDLLITDLCMSPMDGLELTARMRQEHPEIPVILLTAFGDEMTPLKALDAGAASYVPKARQAERLMDTVERVLTHAAADRTRERLAESTVDYHSRFALENDLELIDALVTRVQGVMAGMRFGDSVLRIRVCEALQEALSNAMFHGNLEVNQQEIDALREDFDQRLISRLIEERLREPQFRDRRILVDVHLTAREARFVIRDEGRGFAKKSVEANARARSFESGSQCGLTLMKALMDDVSYNDAGNELVLYKSCAPERSRT